MRGPCASVNDRSGSYSAMCRNERFFCPLSLFLLSRTNTLSLFCTHPHSTVVSCLDYLSLPPGLHTGLIQSKISRNDKTSEKKKCKKSKRSCLCLLSNSCCHAITPFCFFHSLSLSVFSEYRAHTFC